MQVVAGFPVRQAIVRQRNGGSTAGTLPAYEVIYLIAKPKFGRGAYRIGDVWKIPQEADNPRRFRRSWPQGASTDARTALDPFMGSEAAMHGRDWLGIDVSRKYCRTARLRGLARGGAP